MLAKVFVESCGATKQIWDLKSDNPKYNMLGHWVVCPIDPVYYIEDRRIFEKVFASWAV